MKRLLILAVFITACQKLENIGAVPALSPQSEVATYEQSVAQRSSEPATIIEPARTYGSLWSHGRTSLHGDRRASSTGDILTVVISIDDRAEFSNSSQRSRGGSESLAIPDFLSLPERINGRLTGGSTLDSAVSTTSSSNSSGDGAIRRNERLTLRVAATVVEEMQNGVIRIQGTQEVRVNYEVRELLVSGFVRPEDISRQNEITYDKIASARISYGGRGHISDVQQPRYGQQIADAILPF